VTFERAGGSDSAAGIRCDWYRLAVGGKPTGEESCYAPWDSVGVKKAEFKVFEKLEAFARSMADAAGMPSAGEGFRDRFDRAPGAPIIEARVVDGKRQVERKLVSIERGAIPADRFAPPAGFSESQMGRLRGPPPKTRPVEPPGGAPQPGPQ
jgi:hypothetical protein